MESKNKTIKRKQYQQKEKSWVQPLIMPIKKLTKWKQKPNNGIKREQMEIKMEQMEIKMEQMEIESQKIKMKRAQMKIKREQIEIKSERSQKYEIHKSQQKKRPKFNDFHLQLRSKLAEKSLILKNQPYKKFDISKLDFSFDIPSNKLESDKNLNCKGQYTTVVSKSRSNIKKIIELNKLVKDVKVKIQEGRQIDLKKSENDIQILFKIKSGCFGTIYKARLVSTGKLFAIKCIPYDKKHYQREEEICRLISNSYIVKIHKIYYTTLAQADQESFNKLTEKFKQKTSKHIQPTVWLNQNYKINKHLRQSRHNNQKKSENVCQAILDQKRLKHENPKDQEQEELRQNKINDLSKHVASTNKHANFAKDDVSKYQQVTNIVMDLYDCDLNDYIQMKNKVDNLTLKLFSYQMLRSVLYLHSNQICHRDIKPHNFLVKKHEVVLTDFGSAKIMKNHKNSNVSYICSRYYRAPQLIFGYKYYDKSIDIWSIGCVMGQLARGSPLFPGLNSMDQLIKIIRILGQPNWRKISFMINSIPKIPQINAKGLKNVFPKDVSSLFIDLLQDMLVINPLQRITAGQALCHPYFDQIRDQMNFSQICKQMDISKFLSFHRDQLKQSQHLRNRLIPPWVSQNEKIQGQKIQGQKQKDYFNS